MRDRNENGLGRPYNKDVLNRVAKMEKEHPVRLSQPAFSEIVYICPDTKDVTYLHYPSTYSPREALLKALQIDRQRGHPHRPWETWEIK